MLQKKDLLLGEARLLFDGVLEKYPTMGKYLAPDADIINFPDLKEVCYNSCFIYLLFN